MAARSCMAGFMAPKPLAGGGIKVRRMATMCEACRKRFPANKRGIGRMLTHIARCDKAVARAL